MFIIYLKDKKIINHADKTRDGHILLVNLHDPLEESPLISELPKIGILGKIHPKMHNDDIYIFELSLNKLMKNTSKLKYKEAFIML